MRGWEILRKAVKPFAILLAVVMVFSTLFFNSHISFAAESQTQNLRNGGFESDFWNDGSWNIESSNVNNFDISQYPYANDTWMKKDEGDHAFKYWIKDTATGNPSVTVQQTIPALPAGSYELSVKSMGGAASEAGN